MFTLPLQSRLSPPGTPTPTAIATADFDAGADFRHSDAAGADTDNTDNAGPPSGRSRAVPNPRANPRAGPPSRRDRDFNDPNADSRPAAKHRHIFAANPRILRGKD